MSFLGKLFGQSKPQLEDFIPPMVEMANESERTHRGIVDLYRKDVEIGLLTQPSVPIPTKPTARGVFKARLFNSLFMVAGYALKTRDASGGDKLLNIATGIAIEPLSGGGDLTLGRDEAKEMFESFGSSVFRALPGALRQVPVNPMSSSSELDLLADRLHEAHAESLGRSIYGDEVRERFDMAVRANVAASLHHAARWIAA